MNRTLSQIASELNRETIYLAELERIAQQTNDGSKNDQSALLYADLGITPFPEANPTNEPIRVYRVLGRHPSFLDWNSTLLIATHLTTKPEPLRHDEEQAVSISVPSHQQIPYVHLTYGLLKLNSPDNVDEPRCMLPTLSSAPLPTNGAIYRISSLSSFYYGFNLYADGFAFFTRDITDDRTFWRFTLVSPDAERTYFIQNIRTGKYLRYDERRYEVYVDGVSTGERGVKWTLSTSGNGFRVRNGVPSSLPTTFYYLFASPMAQWVQAVEYEDVSGRPYDWFFSYVSPLQNYQDRIESPAVMHVMESDNKAMNTEPPTARSGDG